MNEALWRRVDAALDARVDPFDDPDLAAALAGDPEAERAVRLLSGRLAVLADPGRVARRPALVRRVATVAAALFTLFIGAAYLKQAQTETPVTPAYSADLVRTVSLVVERTSPPPARGARVVLEPRFVMEWSLEGDTQ
jgi:hypothetical protein